MRPGPGAGGSRRRGRSKSCFFLAEGVFFGRVLRSRDIKFLGLVQFFSLLPIIDVAPAVAAEADPRQSRSSLKRHQKVYFKSVEDVWVVMFY